MIHPAPPAERRIQLEPVSPLPSAGPDPAEVVTLIDELLAEQRALTAVERFSSQHDRGDRPLLESHYRDLIPLTAPRPGEQYAFEVDLDACSACKGCVSACHSLNGLEEGETWRSVGLLRGTAAAEARSVVEARRGEFSPPKPRAVVPLTQVVTTACHHCVEPACLLGCPVLAYDKHPVTGIVRHLDDQCIGCSYCILKCPYDVPKYSAKRGIVRKCDLCHGRLAEGEAPACVQACPNQAIRVTTVVKADVRARYATTRTPDADAEGKPANPFLPASPDPAYTLPTTRYLTRREDRQVRAADEARLTPEPAHWPLVWMLVLTQLGSGLLLGAVGQSRGIMAGAAPRAWAGVGLGLLVAGLIASAFHLGQPRKAWRVWMGWRTSWLSREAIALNALAGAATLFTASLWCPVPPGWLHGCVAVGLVGAAALAVFAQGMVYVDTRRRFWAWWETGPRFLGTVAAGMALVAGGGWTLALVILGALACEARVLRHHAGQTWTPPRRTAALLLGPLRPWLGWRVGLGLGAALTAAVGAPVALVGILLTASLLGERSLYFRAVAPERMPGPPA
jgi:formate dehydrogenase iron-sulfur subunit